MRFAEKMLLNAKYFSLVAGARHDRDGRRCALGLVEGPRERIGANCFVSPAGETAEDFYPWLLDIRPRQPCVCKYAPACNISVLIAHLFNEHVMGQLPEYPHNRPEPWTLEKLAGWIDSVDPTPRIVETETVETIAIREGRVVCK